jgi:hypothetical protein
MELIEKHDLRKIHYLNSLTFKQYKDYCPSGKNDEERKIQFNILKEFCKTNIKTRGETKRIYSYSLQTPLETGGRLYCGNSIQGLKKVFRGVLMSHTTDIDMKNAHPVLLSYICKKHNIRCPELDYYISHRDEILSEFENKEVGKTAFLKAVNDNKHNTRITNTFFKKFDKEMKEIQQKVVELECYKDVKSSIPESRKYNWDGSTINRILCMYENKVLQSAISALNSRGIEICSLMFDGVMPYGNYYEDDTLIQSISEKVETDFEGLNMVWTYKPHDTTIQIPDDFEIPVEKVESMGVKSDMEATEVVYKLYPHWVYCLGILYVYDKESGMWVDDKTSYYSVIKKFEKELVLLTLTSDGWNPSSKSYGSTLSLMERIPVLIKTLCSNDNWLKQQQYSSLGKLLFNNGYFDMKKGHFYTKEEINPSIVFFGKIHHHFTEFDEEEMNYMDDLEQRLFFNVLGEDVGEYFMIMLARGLAGDMMKNIMFCLGDTNCGKSTLTTAITLSCGDYVGSFNAENLAYRNSSNDEAQIMRWAMLLRYKRFIFSNEMKSTSEINGNMIKKIASGGDNLIGRNHGKSEEDFITHFLPICFANDLPRIKPYDPAVDNRVRVISYKKKFVDEPTNETELVKDYHLVNEMKTSRFQRVFVGMLIRRYVWANQNNYDVLPEEVKNAKKEWIETTCDYIEKFLESYEITDDEKNYTRSKNIEDWIKDNKLGITMTKFGIELKKYVNMKKYENVMNKCKKLEGKSVMCWFGIKERVD